LANPGAAQKPFWANNYCTGAAQALVDRHIQEQPKSLVDRHVEECIGSLIRYTGAPQTLGDRHPKGAAQKHMYRFITGSCRQTHSGAAKISSRQTCACAENVGSQYQIYRCTTGSFGDK
jgi:hypothetical protein